ncbi:ribonuclease R [Mycoplasma phocimorsus]|uniref:ribonuclease R n=1 Tax=Mycoplasma phocimorsus TaxID=3045839 RepID=UPI0024C01771|nr:ribonuclease R [Mycoplasma phocimorsus]MDJ1647441.1 ribonuclease R [Mycoplasma phocimorsus]
MILELNRDNLQKYLEEQGPKDFISIARFFRIDKKNNKLLSEFLSNLTINHYIFHNRKSDEYYFMKYLKTINGEFKKNKDHFGFIYDDASDESYFVAKEHFKNAYDGDNVMANIYQYGDKQNAVIIALNKRSHKKIVCKLLTVDGIKTLQGFYDTYRFSKFKISNLEQYKDLNNVLVLVKIIGYEKDFLIAEINDVIAKLDSPTLNAQAKLFSLNTNNSFSKEVLEEAALIPDFISEDETRKDFRNELIVTIDGDDTKDFDDAISVSKQDNFYILGVHIADVSFYVKKDSKIDKEALERGTSIYTADKVIPMLPEKLSNGICSLNPNEDRYALSVIMKIDQEGNTKEVKIYPSIIKSKYRLTYNQVNKYIEKQKSINAKVDALINVSYELAKIIRKYKEDEGYVNFEIIEPKIILNENGTVKNILTKQSGISENMIEDFMVRTNEEVAKFLIKKNLPAVFRVHEEPEEEKIDNTNKQLKILGLTSKIDFPSNSLLFAQNIKDIFQEYHHENNDILKILFLRTMAKAVYSSFNIGHFGLASKSYCHFTSPIRRYPDLIVHRILRDYYFANKECNNLEETLLTLDKIAKQNSESEQNALVVERNTNDVRYAEYYHSKIGETFKGIVTTVSKFGMFIELNTKVSVLCHIKNMLNATYEYNEEKEILQAPGARAFKIGDEVEITIVQTNLRDGKIDCVLKDDYLKYINFMNKLKRGSIRLNKANFK